MPGQVPVTTRKTPALEAWPATHLFSTFYEGFDRMMQDFGRTWPSLHLNGDALVRMDCAETKDGLRPAPTSASIAAASVSGCSLSEASTGTTRTWSLR